MKCLMVCSPPRMPVTATCESQAVNKRFDSLTGPPAIPPNPIGRCETSIAEEHPPRLRGSDGPRACLFAGWAPAIAHDAQWTAWAGGRTLLARPQPSTSLAGRGEAGRRRGEAATSGAAHPDDKPATRCGRRGWPENENPGCQHRQRRGSPGQRRRQGSGTGTGSGRGPPGRREASAVSQATCSASSRWQVRTTPSRRSARLPSRDPGRRRRLPPLNERCDRPSTPEQRRGGRGAGEENARAAVDSAGVRSQPRRFARFAIGGKWEPKTPFEEGDW